MVFILLICLMGCGQFKQKPIEKVKNTEMVETETVNNRWKLHHILGNGSFGTVYECIDLNDAGQCHYAVKIEELFSSDNRGFLPLEYLILSELKAADRMNHFPQFFDHGIWQEKTTNRRKVQFMVQTLLGPSLVNLAEPCPKNAFTAGTVANVGLQLLEALQALHEIGYLHRDIKPMNLLCGRWPNVHEIFLIDYGLARKFRDSRGNLWKVRRKARFVGTAAYASLNVHKEQEFGRMDDLWSMLYTLIDLRTGTLPWNNFSNPNVAAQIKRKVIPQNWLRCVEPEYLAVYEYLTSMYYDIEPEYDYINKCFDTILRQLNLTPQSSLDWEPGSTYFEKYYRKNLKEIFET